MRNNVECKSRNKKPAWRALVTLLLCFSASGCAVVAIADAAVTVASVAVSVGATVVGTTVDVAAAGVRGVTGTSNP